MPTVSLPIPKSLYNKDVIVRTCYAFADKADFWLSEHDYNIITVEISYEENVKNIESDFKKSLIDFSLRAQIEEKTKNIREVIISSALLEIKGHR